MQDCNDWKHLTNFEWFSTLIHVTTIIDNKQKKIRLKFINNCNNVFSCLHLKIFKILTFFFTFSWFRYNALHWICVKNEYISANRTNVYNEVKKKEIMHKIIVELDYDIKNVDHNYNKKTIKRRSFSINSSVVFDDFLIR